MIANLRERWYVVATAALLVIAGVVFLVVRSDDSPAKKPVGIAVSPQLDTGGVALASLLTKSRTHEYHATYTSTSDPKVSGGAISMEVWNSGDKSRVDTTLKTTDGQLVHTASILNGKKAVSCQQPPKEEWTCHAAPTPASGDASGLVASLQSQLEGRQVAESPGKVGDRDARCFKVGAAAGAEPIDVCVDKDGVLLKLTSSEASIEIATLDGNVSDSDFKLPGTVK